MQNKTKYFNKEKVIKTFSAITVLALSSSFLVPAITNAYTINNSVNKIEKFEWKINKFSNILLKKLPNSQKGKLKLKQEEIKKLADFYEKRAKSNLYNSEEQYKIFKKRVWLKLISGLSKDFNLWSKLKRNSFKNNFEYKKAINVLKDAIKKNSNSYRIIIKTKLSDSKTKSLLIKMDSSLKIEKLFWNYYSLIIPKNSYFKQDMLSEIEKWILPEKIYKFDIVKPWFIKKTWEYTDGEETTWGVEKIKAEIFQEKLNEDWTKIKVWVLDTWVNYNHSDFDESKSWYDFVNDDNDPMDDHWHWTHVAWTIWATVNSDWLYWVNSNVDIVPLKVLNEDWAGSTYWIIDAIDYSIDHWIKVMNMSFGWDWDPDNSGGLCDAITKAKNKGVISVVAAWNEDKDASKVIPASCDNVIVVWAVDSNLDRASFSNYWDIVDIAAPWVSINSTSKDWDYEKMSGTSMATPHITWLVSAILAFDSSLSFEDVEKLIRENSITINTDKNIWGFADMEKVLDKVITEDEEEENDSNTEEEEETPTEEDDNNSDEEENEEEDTTDDEDTTEEEEENTEEEDDNSDTEEDNNEEKPETNIKSNIPEINIKIPKPNHNNFQNNAKRWFSSFGNY